jgi:hypothetical protein
MTREAVWRRHQKASKPVQWSCSVRCLYKSFNSKLRDEPLNGENFYSLKEAKIIIEG